MAEKRGSRSFANLALDSRKTLLRYNPEIATQWGFKGYDYKASKFTRAAIDAEAAATQRDYNKIKRIDTSVLSRDEKLDYKVLKAQLEMDLEDMNTEDRAIMSPADYLPFGCLNVLMERNVPDLPKKMLARLDKSTRSLDDAMKRIKEDIHIMPKEWVTTGIWHTEDGVLFVDSIIHDNRLKRSKIYRKIVREAKKLEAKAKEYRDYLKHEVKDKAEGTFSIGRERFEMQLTHNHFLKLKPEELFAFGEKLFAETKGQLKRMLKDTTYGIGAYQAMIKKRHPSREELIEVYEKHVQKTIDFIKENNLVPLDFEEELVVRNTPRWAAREFPFVAYLAPPFMKEQKGEVWVNMNTDAKLKEHHYAFIRNTIPHEGYPGHHVQFSLANLIARERDTAWVRLLNESSTMYEGWAIYCEQLMLEQGFTGYKSDKFMLIKDRMWRALRVMIDVGFHTMDWSYEKAKKMMMKNLYFEETEAEEDLDWYIEMPGFPLGYAVGWKMINILRDYEKEKLGKKFSLHDFHKRLLGQGSIGLPLVIERAFSKKALNVVYEEFRDYIK